MTTSAEPDTGSGVPARLGFAPGQLVQEFGYDGDVDDEFRFAIEGLTTTDLEDEDYGGVADGTLLWWRAGDGDLIDALVDALTLLADEGFIVLMTLKPGRPGFVDASDVEESATTAGLHTSGTVNACDDWAATRLVAPKVARR